MQVLWENAELSGERVIVSGDSQLCDRKKRPQKVSCDVETHSILSGDGRLSAVEGSPPLPLLSASLFGRVYSKDADLPLQFCPGQDQATETEAPEKRGK